MKCLNCGKENEDTAASCKFCGSQLSGTINQERIIETINKVESAARYGQRVISNASFTIIVLIMILSGIVFFGIGSYQYISEHIKTNGFEKAEATLKGFTDCEKVEGSETCRAIYEYQIGNVIYTISPNLLTSEDHFKEDTTVCYNPKNPRDAVIYSEWNSLLLIGIVMISIAIILWIIKKTRKAHAIWNITNPSP